MSVTEYVEVSHNGLLLLSLSGCASSRRVQKGVYELRNLGGLLGIVFHTIITQPRQPKDHPTSSDIIAEVDLYQGNVVQVRVSAINALDDLYVDEDGNLRWTTMVRPADADFSLVVV
jgi:hypothetical protein